jgi:hypothetical protein
MMRITLAKNEDKNMDKGAPETGVPQEKDVQVHASAVISVQPDTGLR